MSTSWPPSADAQDEARCASPVPKASAGQPASAPDSTRDPAPDPRCGGWQARALCRDDLPAAAVVAMQVFVSTYAGQGVSAGLAQHVLAQFSVERLVALLHAPDAMVRVLWRPGEASGTPGILGGLAVLRQGRGAPAGPSCQVELETLYVLQALHGQGLGAALLADAEAAVLAQWRQPLWLTVNAGNGSAIRFYQRQGFAIVGEDHFELEGARHLNWVMSRPQG